MRLRIRPSCLCCGDDPIAVWHRRRFLAAIGGGVAGIVLSPRLGFADAAQDVAFVLDQVSVTGCGGSTGGRERDDAKIVTVTCDGFAAMLMV